MRCPCISQTNDSVVRCVRDVGHDGLHHWQDPVHPGHSKMWSGSRTTPESDTRYRFESARRTAARFGVYVDGQGNATYAPMTTGTQEQDDEAGAIEFLQSRGVDMEGV